MNEIWKPVSGYEGLYEVSNLGRVKSLHYKKPHILYPKKHPCGYRQVELRNGNSGKTKCIHRLVAEAFIENPNGLPEVNHLDFDKTNNSVENLEWCTRSRNCKHAWNKPNRKHRVGLRSDKEIIQFSLDGEAIRTWENCIQIKHELSYNQTSIWECCDRKMHTAYGYVWRYAIEYNGGKETT